MMADIVVPTTNGDSATQTSNQQTIEAKYINLLESHVQEQKKAQNLEAELQKLRKQRESDKGATNEDNGTATARENRPADSETQKDGSQSSTSGAKSDAHTSETGQGQISQSEKKSRVKWVEVTGSHYFGLGAEKEVEKWNSADGTSAGGDSEDDEDDKYAVTWRRILNTDGDTAIELGITSSKLRKALKEVVKGYTNVSFDTTDVAFSPPFASIYHCRSKLKEYAEKKADLRTAEDINILLEQIDQQQRTTLKDIETLAGQGEVTEELLWSLFYPGCLVVQRTSLGDMQVAMVAPSSFDRTSSDPDYGGSSKKEPFRLHLDFIDYIDGTFKISTVSVEFDRFQGVKKIVDLPIYPLDRYTSSAPSSDKKTKNTTSKMHPRQKLEQDLIKRGRQFEEICMSAMEHKFKEYSGEALIVRGRENISEDFDPMSDAASSISSMNRRAEEPPVQVNTSSKTYIMVDQEAFSKFSDSASNLFYEKDTNKCCSCATCTSLRQTIIGDIPKNKARNNQLSDQQCLICSPRVLGYMIREKQWAQFRVSNIQDINQDARENAYNSLELEKETKGLLKDLVLQHMKNDKFIDDLIPGKGNGLIVLLHGPPGVGKTLTAESLAILSGKPLCSVTMSDVGTSPISVERNMKQVFELATRWNALLLFDEADIFLEKRSLNDLRRNSLVSVLLRILEYFRGILFLTSNRVKTFDEAFQSRIHVAVQFTELRDSQTQKIWRMWFTKYEDDVEDPDDMLEQLKDGEYANARLNGRQIRNVFSSAMAMARSERSATKMNYTHLAKVLKRTAAFQNYMLQNQQMAEKEGIR